MIRLDQAFGPTVSRGPSESMSYGPPDPVEYRQPPVPQPVHPVQPVRTVDHLGQMLGIPGDVSGSQEFCNMILFISFGIFALFLLDSLVRLAVRSTAG